MSSDRITPFLPTHGLIADYLTFAKGGEDCPRFLFFSFVGALGSVVKRKVWFQRASRATFPPLFPNLWAILVAPQGIGKKSSAIRAARYFIDRLPQEKKSKLLASKLTPEALVKSLASQRVTKSLEAKTHPSAISMLKKKAQGLLYSSEFGVLLGREKYNTGMVALLTDLYDCPDEWNSETIMHGDQVLYDVCINIMAASTPDWMQSMLPSDAFKGGFMSRLLIIAYPENWYIRVAEPPIPPDGYEEKILKNLEILADKQGEIKWTPRAKRFFEDWYNSLTPPEPGPKASYLERKQDHLLKLAMILSLSYAEAFEINENHISQSLSILSSVEHETMKIIDYISVEPRMRGVQRILEYLDNGNEISEPELLEKCWKHMVRPTEFDEFMAMLLKTRRVKMKMIGTIPHYTLIKEERK